MIAGLMLVPALVVILLAAAHFSYHRRNRAHDAQQVIALPDLGYRSIRGPMRALRDADTPGALATTGQRLSGVFQTIDAGGRPSRIAAQLFDGIGTRLAELGGRVVVDGDVRIVDERHVDSLICTGDLIIEGNCVFLSPVKVCGDLIVSGNAAFAKAVVVDGHAAIDGLTAVFAGMVVKGELSVPGQLMVGDRDRESWVAANQLDADGTLLLNGYIDIAHDRDAAGVHSGARAPLVRAVGAPILVAAFGWLLAGPIGAWVANTVVDASCRATISGVACAYAPVAVGFTTAEAILAMTLLAMLFAAQRWLRAQMAYPFIAVMTALGLFAIAYDALIGLPILGEARIINDTMNVLQAIILASFMLTFLVLRQLQLSLLRVATAVALSLGAKTVALVAFILVQRSIGGAAELLLLFALYAFGAFSLHLMAIAWLVRQARPARQRATAARPVKARRSAVEGLRGLAIGLVVVYHYVPPDLFSFNLGKPINSILFVVAGFFFARALGRQVATPRASMAARGRALAMLFVRRHIRIWPLLVIVVGLYLCLSVVDHGPLTQQIRTSWPYYLTYLGYVPRWTLEGQAFPGHLWVVSAQETVIAAICLAIALVGLPRVQKALPALVILGLGSRLIGSILFMPMHPSLALETPLAVLDPFAIGMLTYFGINQRAAQSTLRRQITLALAVAIALWVVLPNWNATYFTLAPLIASLATALLMVVSGDRIRGRGLAASGLTHPALLFLGSISFPLFLLHPFVNTVVRLTFTAASGVALPWWALLAVGPPLSAVAAMFLKRIEARLRAVTARLEPALGKRAVAPRASDLACPEAATSAPTTATLPIAA